MARSISFGYGSLAIIFASLCFISPVGAQDTAQAKEADPLALESAAVEKVETGGGTKFFLEGSIISITLLGPVIQILPVLSCMAT